MLTKEIAVDKIEVTEEGCVLVRTVTRVFEDGALLSSSFHRHVVNPGDDLSAQNQRVSAICAIVHTQEVVEKFKSEVLKGVRS